MKRECPNPRHHCGALRACALALVGGASLFLMADDSSWVFDIAAHPADVVSEQTAALEGTLDAWKSTTAGARSLAVAVDTWDFTTISQEGLNLNTRPFAITIFIR